MSSAHSDSKQRRSKKYRAIHEALRREVAIDKPSKPERKRAKSKAFKKTGETECAS